MNPLISDLLNALIVALVPVAIGALGYLGKQVVSYLQARMSTEQFAMVEALARTAVRSIEQTLSTEEGEAKKAAALALVKAECLKRGYKLDDAAIGAAIEAAVYQERLKQ
ncbi:MAG: phage holin [Hylemonella sp.]